MVYHSKLCMNCFVEIDADDVCENCGWDNRKQQIKNGLPYNTKIGNRYILGRIKAMNGEGVMYSAYDSMSKKVVEVKEFFPQSISERNVQDGWIIPLQGYDSVFDEYLNDFIDLNKNISRLKEVTVIQSVLDIIRQNQTAYVVYEYIPAMTLRRYVEKNSVLSWNTMRSLFLPVISALGLINSLGESHLGISPDTLKLTTEGNLLITGFSIAEARHAGTIFIEELYDGCAAREQYSDKEGYGEYSDVYALAATMIYVISGALPQSALKREKDGRLMISSEYLKDFPPHAITALANALQVDSSKRTPSFEAFKAELSSAPKLHTQVSSTGAIRRLPNMKPGYSGLPPFMWLILTCAVTAIALIIIISAWMRESDMSFADMLDFGRNESSSQLTDLVPNMYGESLEEWQQKVKDGEYDFSIKVKSLMFSDTVEEGHIISQEPSYNEALSNDRVVVVTVSRGSEMRKLPEIRGMTYNELFEVLTNNGFIVSREDVANTDVAAESVIGYKDNKEGESLTFGSEIVLIVSTGTE